jgi:protein-S-isoprenylcysteine O-methyltransferase Ste14
MLRAWLGVGILLLFLAACLFGSAGKLDWAAAWAYLAVFGAFVVAAFALVDPSLIRERAAPGPDVDRGDAALAGLGFVGLYPGTLIVAGLDAVRFGWSPSLSLSAQLPALLVFVLGYALALWAMRANPFFATFVRIQGERGHSVVGTGPYAWVRHPGYAGTLIAHAALPVALGSLWALAPASFGCLLFVLRTAREDRTLEARLRGYREYQLRVPWRLFRGIW